MATHPGVRRSYRGHGRGERGSMARDAAAFVFSRRGRGAARAMAVVRPPPRPRPARRSASARVHAACARRGMGGPHAPGLGDSAATCKRVLQGDTPHSHVRRGLPPLCRRCSRRPSPPPPPRTSGEVSGGRGGAAEGSTRAPVAAVTRAHSARTPCACHTCPRCGLTPCRRAVHARRRVWRGGARAKRPCPWRCWEGGRGGRGSRRVGGGRCG